MFAVQIGKYDSDPEPFFVERGRDVHLSDKILRCVAFIGSKTNGKFTPRATAFFVQIIDGQHRFDHLVTAQHVVAMMLSKGHDLWLRVNLINPNFG